MYIIKQESLVLVYKQSGVERKPVPKSSSDIGPAGETAYIVQDKICQGQREEVCAFHIGDVWENMLITLN